MSDLKEKAKLRFGLPKGSLQEAAIEKMAKAGWNISVSSRSYVPYVDDEEMEIRLIRAQVVDVAIVLGARVTKNAVIHRCARERSRD